MEFPQEIELWYIIPAIRKDLVKQLKEENLKQKQIAKALGLTEAAISQYLKDKRGKSIEFNKEISNKIKQSAKIIFKNIDNQKLSSIVMQEIQTICNYIKSSKFICKIHKQKNKDLDHCDICYCK
ncbi:helix-turn-helix domain-containing protein [Candidatus Woesearchaeota archaeon]|jgi:uncharacterized protein|nr:helix-turn-helix domain-containing protein [Candidatus Woesearchaeota archaeon]MBT7366660.1 helix-turn-helix domain-containing protein [Candidatus Woesearchaeota archaeon]